MNAHGWHVGSVATSAPSLPVSVRPSVEHSDSVGYVPVITMSHRNVQPNVSIKVVASYRYCYRPREDTDGVRQPPLKRSVHPIGVLELTKNESG